jgi:hypothetical protein
MSMRLLFFLLGSSCMLDATAGFFDPAAGQPGSLAVSMSDAGFANGGWASGVASYTAGANVDLVWQQTARALGAATGDSFDIVSLGEGGSITLSFDRPIYNGAGWDFAVFENSFSDTFLELAWVSVSSDGQNFFRFPGFSFTPAPVGPFGSVDPTNISGLAGKYRAGFGTTFDLAIFSGISGIDINAISHVRVSDIIGDGRELDSWPASAGGPHPIYDPYQTTGSAGFDLEAIGARYLDAVVEPPDPVSVPLQGAELALAPLLAYRMTRRRPEGRPTLGRAGSSGS